ncbi:MAG: DUF4169 family protein [Rubritepida sp.]|jgi:hypothetical protein|nr:DUF4169 family protein [Rubritepida sp.]MCU0944536.1 DUF4169 family protein [Rubritepida sp.]
MGEVINLRKWRARRDKERSAAEAAANRRAFGRTAGEKRRDALEARQRDAKLDQAKLGAPRPKDGPEG